MLGNGVLNERGRFQKHARPIIQRSYISVQAVAQEVPIKGNPSPNRKRQK